MRTDICQEYRFSIMLQLRGPTSEPLCAMRRCQAKKTCGSPSVLCEKHARMPKGAESQQTTDTSLSLSNTFFSTIRRMRVLTSSILPSNATVPTAKGKNSDCCAESQCFGAAERRMLSEGLCSVKIFFPTSRAVREVC